MGMRQTNPPMTIHAVRLSENTHNPMANVTAPTTAAIMTTPVASLDSLVSVRWRASLTRWTTASVSMVTVWQAQLAVRHCCHALLQVLLDRVSP